MSRTPSWALALSLARSLALLLARWLACSLSRSLACALAHSLAHSHTRSLARSLSLICIVALHCHNASLRKKPIYSKNK